MSKDKRQTESSDRDPQFLDAEFAYNNMLALPQELKTYLTEKGLDWRFLNATQFRSAGNYHRSNWKALNIREHMTATGMVSGVTAEGLIQRGDLVLGVRPKAISAKHREFLAEKNRRYSNFNKEKAKELRDDVRRKGISGVSVEEGYGED